ncbi:hypothetical protein QNO07_21895 [Streptomyces sp. 549]|uniref:hypothetical protein n=1 Tax=Streptomyces sp. 549 TaxID=3049076 RepID=UPI0024C26A3C|nr:hypothetical protein [Streptomyces sp. 549]MDK1476038.1 hypothetical protein [Streptomyces sp. 549]
MRSNMTASAAVAAAMAGALAFGTIGTAVAATPAMARAESTTAEAPAAPLPADEALAGQVRAMSQAGGVLTPVSHLFDAVLKADGGKLTAEEAAKHQAAVRTALDAVQEQAPAADARRAAAPGADVSKSAADLQKKVDALVEAAAANDPSSIVTALTDALGAVLELVLGLLGGSLPELPTDGVPTPAAPGSRLRGRRVL